MKILHLSNVICEKSGGGVHEVVKNLYKYQKELGHEPHIWYPGTKDDSDSIKLDDNIRALNTYGNKKYGIIKDLFKPLHKSIKYFDIIHQHGVWMPISLFNLRIKSSLGIPSIVQPHGFLEPYRLNQKKIKKKIVFDLYENKNIKTSDLLLACSKDESKKLKKMFYDKTIATIENGIDSEFLHAHSLKNKNINKKILLFLSQIIPIKGLDRLIEIINELGRDKFKGWELHIAGDNSGKYGHKLLSKVSELKLDDIIKFIGPKHGKDKLKVFDNSSAFILPTFNENFGIVVAEALSRAKPVITTQGTPWEDLKLFNCGFWAENNKKGIKTSIMKLLLMTDHELELMGLRGKKMIEKKYMWSIAAKKTIELYKWMIKKGQKPDFII